MDIAHNVVRRKGDRTDRKRLSAGQSFFCKNVTTDYHSVESILKSSKKYKKSKNSC
jgi:hypothetical protein